MNATSPADRLSGAVFSIDAAFRLVSFNDRALALFAASDVSVGSDLWTVVPDEIERQVDDELERAMAEGVPTTVEVDDPRFDARFELRVSPSDAGLTVSVFDVDETVTQHAAVVEAIDDGVVTIDRNRRIVALNPAMAAFLGVDAEDVVGDDVETIIDVAGIDDDSAQEIRRGIAAVDRGVDDRRRLEVPFTDGDGTDRVGELRFVPLQGETASVAAVVRDITDRHEYERVVDSLHEVTRWLLESDDPEEICAVAVQAGSDLLDLPISGIWLLEEERGYLDPVAGTARAYDEFGGFPRFRPGEGLVWDVFESGDVERFDDLRTVEGAYNPDSPIRSEIIAPIGTRGVLMTGSFDPYQFDDTDVDLVSTLVENTNAALERADRERVLRERTAQLERQTRRLETIADALSTDLKRNLETIADALEGADSGAPAEASIETTLDSTDRLVDDVRALARNAGTVRTRTRIDLGEAVEAAAEASRLPTDAVVVERSATLRADGERFRQLLESAFDNAAARADGDGVAVRIDVCGIDDGDERTRGFCLIDDASERATGATAPDDAAVDGLGLAAVRAIAQAHDWTVEIGTDDAGRTEIAVRNVATLERDGR